MTHPTPQQLLVDNPFTLQPVVERPYSSSAELEGALRDAQRAFEAWANTDIEARRTLCTQAVEAMVADEERIAHDITRMMGKPLRQAKNELRGMAGRAHHMIAIAEAALADTLIDGKPGFERRIERVPLGVVLNMPAWNYPLLTCVNALIPAVLAGNAVLLKHSTRSALCGEHFADAFQRAGAPHGLVSAIFCDHDAAAELAKHADYVAFTGSVAGGHAVYRAVAAGHFSDVGLELGGKDAAYLAADADVASAAAGIADGACYNAGQSCCAVERVYVHSSIYDDVVEAVRGELAKLRLGDPESDVDMGPLAQPNAAAFLAGQVDDARQRGAEVLLGGNATTVDGKGRFFEPTLIVNANHEMDVMRVESFGPLLPIMAVDSDEQALALMNDSDLGLTASVWTRDRERAATLARRLEVGTVYMNQCDTLDPALPWTGVKDTGKGTTLSALGFSHVTRPRSINFKL